MSVHLGEFRGRWAARMGKDRDGFNFRNERRTLLYDLLKTKKLTALDVPWKQRQPCRMALNFKVALQDLAKTWA